MLVLTRHVGEAVVVGSPDTHSIITVLSVTQSGASLRIADTCELDPRNVELTRRYPVHIGTTIEIRLVEACEERDLIRIGVIAPVTICVHRMETWKAIHSESTNTSLPNDPGSSGSPAS